MATFHFNLGEKVENLSEKIEGEVTQIKPFKVDDKETNPHMWISKEREKVKDHPFYRKW